MKRTVSSCLAISIALLMLLATIQVPAGASGGPPSPGVVFGYVSVNGIAVNGITVSISGSGLSESCTTVNDAAGQPGYYQFGVLNSSSYTVSAGYGGKSASRDFTATGPGVRADLDISYSGPPMPAAVYGYVTVNGAGTNGVTVTLQGCGATESYTTRNDASGRAGYYQFGILSVTSYTVSAGYDGHSVSRDFTTGSPKEQVNLPITVSSGGQVTVTPDPTGSPGSSVTPTPTSTADTPTPTAGASVTPGPSGTPTDSSSTPTTDPTQLPSPSPVPFPGIEGLMAIALGIVICAMISKKG